MTSDNLLGEFLRARRELTRPEEHGLPDLRRRRVPGLRREEVAILSGISAEYYIRLERGRDRRPSASVIEALARVLDLDEESTRYLAALATERPRAPKAAARPDEPPPAVLRILNSLSDAPALVLGPYLDVLAHNRLAERLYAGPPGGAPGVGNMLRALFLDPGSRRMYPDWEDVAVETVASLRASAGSDLDDPRLIQLVGELSVKSADFGRLWARHEVRAKTSGVKRMISPSVGPITLTWESLSVTSAPGQLVVTYFAEPGSVSEQLLATLAADA
jgi:transcriptional regulator with XRE-family HTH domain